MHFRKNHFRQKFYDFEEKDKIYHWFDIQWYLARSRLRQGPFEFLKWNLSFFIPYSHSLLRYNNDNIY